jgi:hypothetical protein
MPAVMLTLLSRLETLNVENNPGGRLLAVDPYAGLIANTESSGDGSGPVSRWRSIVGRARPRDPVLADPRTVAHHRAVWNLLGGLDRAAAKREQVQAMRRRCDAEIFGRFPLYLVPTYPGDQALFRSAGFRAWLPADLPLASSTLEEVMAWER